MIGLLDTSSMGLSLAFVDAEGKILHGEFTGVRNGVSRLLPERLGALQSEGLDMSSIREWRVGLGPGSFTGTRVGIAFLLGLTVGQAEVSLAGVNSAFSFLPQVLLENPEAKSFAVLHDGRRGEVLLNVLLLENGTWQSEGEVRILAINDELTQTLEIYDELISPLPAVAFKAVPELAQRVLLTQELSAEGLALCPSPQVSLEPIYVRPAVFVEPKTFREI